MAQVKGSAITARLRFVRERYGEPGLLRLFASLTPAHAVMVKGKVLPSTWMPYDLFIALNMVIDQLFGVGDLQLCYELGRYGAEVNLPTLYRLFYRLSTPDFIFRKAAQLWDVHYDSGILVPILDGPHAYRLRIEKFAEPHRAHCLSIAGWAARSAEMSGAASVKIDELLCRCFGDDVCEMRVIWGS